jgi:hypothetical protein
VRRTANTQNNAAKQKAMKDKTSAEVAQYFAPADWSVSGSQNYCIVLLHVRRKRRLEYGLEVE